MTTGPDGTGFPLQPEAQAEILLVDDDPTAIVVLSRILGDSFRLRYATNGPDALKLARRQRPDLVLLDIEMPGMSGIDVCHELKRDAAWDDVPVIFITSHHSQADELAGLAAGAVDFIAKPPLAPLVRARVATHLRLKRLTDLLKLSAVQDAVTGIGNRRAFEERLPKAWLRALRERKPLSVVMIDVDHFKEYNDTLGHLRGDECLRAVATCLAHTLVGRDTLLARYGGDEFVLVAPDLNAAEAQDLAKTMHSNIRQMQLPHPSSPISDVVTVSIGGSTCAPTPDYGPEIFGSAGGGLLGPEILLLAADRALYTAKAAGRDQVRFGPLAAPDEPGSATESGVHG